MQNQMPVSVSDLRVWADGVGQDVHDGGADLTLHPLPLPGHGRWREVRERFHYYTRTCVYEPLIYEDARKAYGRELLPIDLCLVGMVYPLPLQEPRGEVQGAHLLFRDLQ
jgi:hypothetical protein